MIAQTLPGFPPPPKESLSQWDTPRSLARRIAEWANITDGTEVLEPSAGLGSLACAAMDLGAKVLCVEIDPDRCAHLERVAPLVICKDFLSTRLNGRHELALMNPPFEGDQDAMHIEHALLFVPRVVAHVPTTILCGVGNYERLWSKHTLSRVALSVRRPKYAGDGGRTDMCTLEILRGKSANERTSIEWWS